jgi:hypothetical protein
MVPLAPNLAEKPTHGGEVEGRFSNPYKQMRIFQFPSVRASNWCKDLTKVVSLI